ncbi:hypothetical protein CAL26_17545 [Bordetella genomosp. 9]|uniref:DUF4136 domain-containing protein n=1 Tax=Bordetella genomosp. 9 TaxID=1416803 RepID=A0A261R318_9BORD|nr:DUF4136 domain-containing protein [Bordetella genomosp. 9]OZI19428.1 hypothetical protein CAL26_17545 [Bordetella genomosp. 9]
MYRADSSRILRFAQALALLLLAGLVAGCATTPTVSARVTSFQDWPAGATGQRYRFVPADPSQNNNLEYQSFQDMVRSGISPTGLVEAQAGQPARFDVSFKYGVTQTQVNVRRPVDPYFYGGYGPGFYGGRYWGSPWGPGMWGPDWVDTPSVAYRNALTVEIRDASQGGKEVYRATAYSVSGNDRLLAVMPYLVRAIFDNFPANNGSEREVRYTMGR